MTAGSVSIHPTRRLKERHARLRVVLLLAHGAWTSVPAWGKGPAKTDVVSGLVRLDDWGRAVPTFVLDRKSVV